MSPIAPNDLVLVTGANGYIASHIADQLLASGHRVRGTVRTAAKGQWLQSLFDAKHGPDRFTFALVPDLSKPGALADAIKGASGVAHVASDLSFSPDPNAVIPGVIASVRAVLVTAATEPGVRRFVYTSSSTAALNPVPEREVTVQADTWNEEAIAAAWKPPPYEPARAYTVYAASKMEGERELWRFMEERKPNFEANAVLPNANFGEQLNVEEQKGSSTSGLIAALWGVEKVPEAIRPFAPQYFVNVVDTARLHVAALTSPRIVSERIFAFAATFKWNEVLAALRNVCPSGTTLPSDIPDSEGGNARDLSVIVPRARAGQILREECGREGGFVGLEESMREHVKGW